MKRFFTLISKSFLLFFCCILHLWITTILNAQSYQSTPTAMIPDNNCDATNEFTLDLSAESLANLDGATLVFFRVLK